MRNGMRNRSKALFCSIALAGAVAVGCGSDADDTTASEAASSIESVVGSAATRAGEASQDVLASLHTESERLMDDIQSGDTGKADTARKELLDNCRDSLEQLRQDEAPEADQVEGLCDKIRDADTDAEWTEVQSELAALSGSGSGSSGATTTSGSSSGGGTTASTMASTTATTRS